MTTIGWILFGLPVAIGFYAYVIYPVILWIVAKPQTVPARAPQSWPRVCIVLPAYNEEAQIGGAIDAILAQNYPADRLAVLIVSDASTDDTDSIVESYSSRGVQLLRMPHRGGKTKAENAARAYLDGDIAVNTDASIRLHPEAVCELVKRMQDHHVGVASGRDVSISHARASANATEAGYVQYEMRIRALETRSGGIVGASGSCYAMLTALQKIDVRDDLSRDFSAALTAHANGYRAISVDEAICFVPRTSSLKIEFKRKVRTLSRGMDTLSHRADLINPRKHGTFAWKLISHKICRWALPVAAVPGLAGLMLLATSHSWARLLVAISGLVVALALTGVVWPTQSRVPRIFSVPAFALAANLAVLIAVKRLILKQDDAIWEPTRRLPSSQ